ncbi:hypothetical protein [Sinorhizobium meliloti]|uniref:hypothetical protein n=1 Tax=Rhizobium meliloti TaxID=382 RepID=UPI000FDCDD3B|nr:hypothetical protein [Sinorhizobium meliloti]RVG08621.1 hypothetical protein CN231_26850 [Sinorhizobium meliloti]UFX06663.1 hypothetical protein SmelRRI128_09215 [Sinorhizobium meliloti]
MEYRYRLERFLGGHRQPLRRALGRHRILGRGGNDRHLVAGLAVYTSAKLAGLFTGRGAAVFSLPLFRRRPFARLDRLDQLAGLDAGNHDEQCHDKPNAHLDPVQYKPDANKVRIRAVRTLTGRLLFGNPTPVALIVCKLLDLVVVYRRRIKHRNHNREPSHKGNYPMPSAHITPPQIVACIVKGEG